MGYTAGRPEQPERGALPTGLEQEDIQAIWDRIMSDPSQMAAWFDVRTPQEQRVLSDAMRSLAGSLKGLDPSLTDPNFIYRYLYEHPERIRFQVSPTARGPAGQPLERTMEGAQYYDPRERAWKVWTQPGVPPGIPAHELVHQYLTLTGAPEYEPSPSEMIWGPSSADVRAQYGKPGGPVLAGELLPYYFSDPDLVRVLNGPALLRGLQRLMQRSP